jgi:hypothetical protein
MSGNPQSDSPLIAIASKVIHLWLYNSMSREEIYELTANIRESLRNIPARITPNQSVEKPRQPTFDYLGS